MECAAQSGSGNRTRTQVPAQQGHLPQGPHFKGDYTKHPKMHWKDVFVLNGSGTVVALSELI